MKWFKGLFHKKQKTPYYIRYEQSDEMRVFEDLEETQQKKQRLQVYLEQLQTRLQTLENFSKFDEEQRTKLMSLIGQYKAIVEDKRHLKGRLVKTNPGLLRLQSYEEVLPQLMEEVRQIEHQTKENERDLYFLDEERTKLLEDRQTLLTGYGFLKGLSIGVSILIMVSLFLGFGLMQVLKDGIWLYLSSVTVIFVFFIAGVLFAKDHLEKRLRINEQLQKKVVRYINRTKIKYFHNKNYLTFHYEKLGVDSSAKLEMYYNRYIKNKANEQIYTKLNRQLMAIETTISDLVEEKAITFETIDDLENGLIASKKAETLQNLQEESMHLKAQVEDLETFEETLWKELYALKEDPRYKERVEEAINKQLDKA